MEIETDSDVKMILEFMQANVAASRLAGVATAIGRLAPILWGRFGIEEVHPLRLAADPISGCDPARQSASSESHPVL